jgi:hypothetical protein
MPSFILAVSVGILPCNGVRRGGGLRCITSYGGVQLYICVCGMRKGGSDSRTQLVVEWILARPKPLHSWLSTYHLSSQYYSVCRDLTDSTVPEDPSSRPSLNTTTCSLHLPRTRGTRIQKPDNTDCEALQTCLLQAPIYRYDHTSIESWVF